MPPNMWSDVKPTLQKHASSSVFPPVKMAAPPPESSGSNEDVETGPVRLTGFVANVFYFWRPDGLVDDEERKPIAKEVQTNTFGLQFMDMVRRRANSEHAAGSALMSCSRADWRDIPHTTTRLGCQYV
jgi:hypothetical protein